MLFDIYMILLTGFAVFGVYCFVDMLYTLFYMKKVPKTVTFLNYSIDPFTQRKIRLMQNSVGNNDIVFISENMENIYDDTKISKKADIMQYIDNGLFTK
ncbi:MAG: hypothetical protein RR273_06605, partial [Oscillospiraceae bacterium]